MRKQLEAKKDLAAGKLVYTFNINFGGELPRYENEIAEVLESYSVYFLIIPISDAFPDGQHCYKNFMDSALTAKFGTSFIQNINEQADSLFYERHKNSVFDYWDVDEWAIHPSNQQQLGGDYIIEYLNKSLEEKSNYRFVSNIVDRPYVTIELIIDKLGNTSSCTISERELHSLKNIDIDHLENLITQTVEKIDDWIPAKLSGKPVIAKFQRGVAIELK